MGTYYLKGGKKMGIRDLTNSVKGNHEIEKEMRIAKNYYYTAFIFDFSGGCLIGYAISNVIIKGKTNWTLAAIGAGMTTISIPFTLRFTKHATKAVKMYNNKMRF